MERVKVTFLPGAQAVLVPQGETILRAAVLAGLALDAPCAGRGTCGKCKVKATGGLGPPGDTEQAGLGPQELSQGIRLACLAPLWNDAQVELPQGLTTRELASARHKAGTETGAVSPRRPYVSKVTLPVAELEGGPMAGLESTRLALSRRGHRPQEASVEALRQLGLALKEQDTITLVLAGKQIIAVEPGDTRGACYGVALDIGTSTLAGYLMDLNSGTQVAAFATANPQASYGQDVVSRIQYALEFPTGLEELRQKVVEAINQLLGQLAKEAGVELEAIYEITVVGNTTMLHLLLAIDPTGLAVAPYRAVVTGALELPASRLGLETNPQGRSYLLPSLAAFVGADTVTAILATGLHRSHEIKLLMDLGTNGEVVLGSRERLLCCSAAAGPAFEGGRIRHGMIALPGAVDRVLLDGDVVVGVIPGARPRGICGSGLIDAVAEMVRYGVVDASGRMLQPEVAPTRLPPHLARRVQEDRIGCHFVLVEAAQSFDGQPIALYQEDVRQLQLAKAALRAGVETLKQELGVGDKDIAQVLLAGAFGSYINKENAAAIGLLPQVPLERVRAVGNAAGQGAKKALCSIGARREANSIAHRTQYIELSTHPQFPDRFVAAIPFPIPK